MSISKKKTKKVGRKALVPNRTERITFYLKPKTSERLNIALFQEQLRQVGQKRSIDKSLLIENAIIEWLNKKKIKKI